MVAYKSFGSDRSGVRGRESKKNSGGREIIRPRGREVNIVSGWEEE